MSGSHKTVYLVDDDEAVRDSTRFLLESTGFSTRDFPGAAQFLEADISNMGCLLLDLHMPEMSGLELLRILRSRGCNEPIIVISGRRDPAQDAELREAGASALLSKPFDEDELLKLISGALKA
jgi:FixJ family two-component response regulator